ncbi:MAG: hypothetical protein V3T31_03095, partial [candidate division Zixibacteria bacterium]
MTGIFRHIVLWLAVIVLMAVTGQAQTHLDGKLGVDYETFSYANSMKDTTRDFSSSRGRSGQFLELDLGGPMINSYFGHYLLSTSFVGDYFGSKTPDSSFQEYIVPRLQSIQGEVSLLPEKWYPISFYGSLAKINLLRPERNNRTDTERARPELSVARRYYTEADSRGVQWQLKPTQQIKMLNEYKSSALTAERIYDLGEDLDPWVTFIGFKDVPNDSVYFFVFKNVTDDSIRVYLENLDSLDFGSDAYVTDFWIPPDSSVTYYSVFMGMNKLLIESDSLNRYSTQFRVEQNYLLTYELPDQAAPNDLEQTITGFSSGLTYGETGPFKNEAFYEYTDSRESRIGQVTFGNNFTNSASWKASRSISLSTFTSIQSSQMTIDTISDQSSGMFQNQTTMNFEGKRGLSATVSHMYSKSTSEVGVDSAIFLTDPFDSTIVDTTRDDFFNRTQSTLNSVLGQFNMRFRKFDYEPELKVNANLLSDNSGMGNDQYSSEFVQKARFRLFGMELLPVNTTKYSFNEQVNPDNSSNEIEN